jgi:NADH dehydrogenase
VARALGRAPVRVTLLDRNNYHLFQPLLYQVATATLSPSQITMPLRRILRRQRNTEVYLGEVSGVDLENRRVLLHDRTMSYDTLVVATGSGPGYFGHDDWSRFAPPLKSIEDALLIRRKILLAFETAEEEGDEARRQALLTFVLVGAGPTGVEMAGAIAEIARSTLAPEYRHVDARAARIILMEAAPRILGGFPEALAAAARRHLEEMGVEIRVGKPVERVDPDGVFVGGERIAAATVLWTAGVVPSPAGRWLAAPVDRQGRVLVEKDLSLPNHPEVFVIGDAAHAEEDGRLLPGLAPVAMQEGRHVAQVIRRRLIGEAPPRPFHFVDKGDLATIGRGYAVAVVRNLHLSGFAAWLVWLGVHIFYLIGFRNRFLVLLEWGWAYLTYQRGARIISPPAGSHGPREREIGWG